MTIISSIPPLNGSNYNVWREKLELALALSNNDLALISPCSTKPMDPVRAENETHLIFASLPKECETFVVNYNLQPDKWDIEKLIAMCVQEEERLKSSHGDSANM